MQTDRSLESTEIAFFSLDSFVPGSRPKCSSNGVFFVSECMVNRRTYSALFRLSGRFCVSSKLVFVRLFSDWMVLSTNPVPVCRFGVPYLRIILYSLQKLSYSLEIKALPLSDLIVFGTPYTFIYSRRNVKSVSWFVFLQICATGQRQFLSTATNIKGDESKWLLFRFLVKSIWISSPGFFGGSSFDFSVLGNWVYKFLPAFKHAELVFAFFSISARIFGHQKITASLHILFFLGWPKCSALSAA